MTILLDGLPECKPLLALQLEPTVLIVLRERTDPVLVDDGLAPYPGIDFDDQIQPYHSSRVASWRCVAAAFYLDEANRAIRDSLGEAIRAMDRHLAYHGVSRVLAIEGVAVHPVLVEA
jgi:hypothetical protein